MRTTITLEPDVAARLKAITRERGISFKEAVNAALRRGLGADAVRPRPFRTETQSLGLREGVDLDHALRIADAFEDAELVRKLELRK